MATAFAQLAEAVFAQRPTLAEIYKKFGNQTLFDYVNSWQVPKTSLPPVFLQAFFQEVARLYGKDIARKAADQLTNKPLVSTIDHHGLLGHPFFVNANLLFSLSNHQEYLITLPTAGVSMNNQSSWSGCLLYHKQTLEKLPLHPQSKTMHVVWQAPALQSNDMEKFLTHLFQTNLTQGEQKLIEQLLAKVFTQELMNRKNFSDQASLASSQLWQEYFPAAPKLLYVPLENIINRVLSELLTQQHELWELLLCRKQGWEKLEEHFQGVAGAFAGPHKGSFLFWGIDSTGNRIHLQRQGSQLVGDGMALELSEHNLLETLSQGRVYPTSLVCFLVLLFCNVTCVGGFNQTSWLTAIKKEFLNLLNELGFQNVASDIAQAVTDNFGESPLAFLPKDEELVPAAGLDILFSADKNLYQKYLKLSNQLTLKDSIDLELADMYRVVVPSSQQDKSLLAEAAKANLHVQISRLLNN